MITWEFPNSFDNIWNERSGVEKLNLITHCLQNPDFPESRHVVRKLAATLRTRENTILGWPTNKVANHLLRLCDTNKVDLEAIFRGYFFHAQIPLMTTFLDSLGIPHHAGMVTKEWNSIPTASELEGAIAHLVKKFPPRDVLLYTQVLTIAGATHWVNMRHIDFTRIESLLDLPDPISAPPTAALGALSNAGQNLVLPCDSESRVETVSIDEINEDENEADLNHSLARIRMEFSQAALRLEHDLQLINQGALPSEESPRILVRLKKMHGDLLNRVRVRAEALGILQTIDISTSLEQFTEIIATIQKADNEVHEQERCKQEAICLLDSVLRLSRTDGREFPPLTACQDSARDLRSKLLQAAVPLDQEALLALQPYESLVLMTKMQEELDEDQSLAAFDSIGRHFGGKLVFAVTRGLVVAQTPPGGAKQKEIPAGGTESPTADDVRPSSEDERSVERPDPDPFIEEISPPDVTVPTSHLTPPSHTAADEPGGIAISVGAGFYTPGTSETPLASRFRYLKTEETASLAAQLLGSEQAGAPESIERLVWLALLEQKVSIAHHLVHALDRAHPLEYVEFLSNLRALALGQELRHPLGSIAEQLRDDFGLSAGLSDFYSSENSIGHRLLLVASSLRAAVVDPSTNAQGAIEIGIHGLLELPKFCRICKQVSEYASLQVPLDPIALELVGASENLSERIAKVHVEASAWWVQAPNLAFKNVFLERIWARWLDFDGPIFRMISPIVNRDRNALVQQRQIVETLSTEGRIRSEVNATDRQLRGRGLGGNLSISHVSVLIRYVREAVDFTTRWIALQEHETPEYLNYSRKKLLELYTSLIASRVEVEAELSEASETSDDIRVRAGIRLCQLALENLVRFLKPQRDERVTEPEIRYVLSRDVLLIPGLRLSDAWMPTADFDAVIQRLLEHLKNGSPCDWRAAFQYFSDRRDHVGTDRILEFLTWSGDQNELVVELSTAQRDHIRQCQHALKRQVEDCSKNIESAVVLGLVREKERATFLDIIERIKKDFPLIRDFGKEHARIAAINSEIETSRKHHVEGVRIRLDQENISPESLEYARIAAVIHKGDVHTANEYIDLAARGDKLPEIPDEYDYFSAFFPYGAADIDAFLSDPKQSGSLFNRVESGKGLPGVEMRNVPEAQPQEAVEMLEAWFALKKAKRPVVTEIQKLFARLGFEVAEVGQSTSYPRAWIPLRVTPIVHKSQCPMPYFGSMANGRYRVLCVWDRPSEDEIINQIRTGRQGTPPIVLYFGKLTEQKRRYLAQLSRAEQLSFVFIDELLLVYLCGQRGSRLPVLFQCALPFAFVSPYTTTASNVPPEMFYGRRTERTQIMDPMGSCFVYGGRQLGKTALLLSIRAEFNDLAQGRIALWIDLKALGSTQDDIWAHLIRSFKEIKDVELHIKDIRSEQKLFERLQDWLNRDERRRILILLDEADRFLESDSKDGYPRTSILKGWMEKTNRRFKVVFAGLHNVQRTTKQQNHPLAHFGEPICVGPLLDGGEWKEAIALIERPLWSMGFRFESRDLVMRILSQTNYYPSLIQLYCNQLFFYLARDGANHFDWRKSPPYIITTKHVEDAYTSLRGKIRERFELTLNLDIRYRVIALIIALNSLSDGRVSSELLNVGRIQANAFSFWEQGFQDCASREDFAVLLEEMVGLGVLREVNEKYALRTPNLLSLLGTEEEIADKLLKTSEESPPPPFMPSVFRTSDQGWKRNPLTVLQEGELHAERHAVTLIVGTRAAGLDDLESFLARSFEGSLERWDAELTDRTAFRRRLDELQDKLRQGTTLILIQNNPWNLSWLEETIEWSKKKAEKAVSRFCNFAFVADPESMWRLVQDRPRIEEMIARKFPTAVSLQPWNSSVLRQWLGDCQIGSNTVGEEREISAKTGNWPLLLTDFRTRVTNGQKWQTALAETYESVTKPSSDSSLFEAFGLHIPQTYKVLSELAQLGGQASIAEMIELLDPIPAQLISNVLFWADRLNLVRRSGSNTPDEDQWALNPIVKDLLLSGQL